MVFLPAPSAGDAANSAAFNGLNQGSQGINQGAQGGVNVGKQQALPPALQKIPLPPGQAVLTPKQADDAIALATSRMSPEDKLDFDKNYVTAMKYEGQDYDGLSGDQKEDLGNALASLNKSVADHSTENSNHLLSQFSANYFLKDDPTLLSTQTLNSLILGVPNAGSAPSAAILADDELSNVMAQATPQEKAILQAAVDITMKYVGKDFGDLSLDEKKEFCLALVTANKMYDHISNDGVNAAKFSFGSGLQALPGILLNGVPDSMSPEFILSLVTGRPQLPAPAKSDVSAADERSVKENPFMSAGAIAATRFAQLDTVKSNRDKGFQAALLDASLTMLYSEVKHELGDIAKKNYDVQARQAMMAAISAGISMGVAIVSFAGSMVCAAGAAAKGLGGAKAPTTGASAGAGTGNVPKPPTTSAAAGMTKPTGPLPPTPTASGASAATGGVPAPSSTPPAGAAPAPSAPVPAGGKPPPTKMEIFQQNSSALSMAFTGPLSQMGNSLGDMMKGINDMYAYQELGSLERRRINLESMADLIMKMKGTLSDMSRDAFDANDKVRDDMKNQNQLQRSLSALRAN